ncbi:MAG: carbohydrate-binding family V/XII, partial [Deltaproteobacteria bacterium]|nr:carbohydrate-binding family V/XII [Deltaproteobacteria bacterium]
EPGPPPKIIVVTEPTELISSTGKPEYTPISGTDLLYMSNSDSDVLMHIGNQEHYIFLSGRWYAAAKLQGPWRYVPGGELPPDFAKISEDSEMGTVLYAVPGTEAAKEAVLDAHVPQTAAVDRKKAELKVEYDGNPNFEKIEGTQMTYAVNTATAVIRVENRYYACDEAVWFVADGAQGPWRVAASVPGEIYTIPADCPIYNVTFVRIYNATPEVVYVGYTPGYTNTYVYNTTIVYGTGYYWPGWYGRYYFPRPATWGFHVRWNPWRGWSFGFSYGWGPFRFTIGGGGWYRGGWWGPGRHRGYRHGYRHGRRAGYRAGYHAGRRSASHQNMYRSQRNQARTQARASTGKTRAKAGAASNRPNNVYADRNGDIHRKTDQGW